MITYCLTAEQTRHFGEEYSRGLQSGMVVSLTGDLGAGKTELVKGIAQGIGYPGDVTSPTFTLIHEYQGGRLPIYHMDLYRIEEEIELDELGFEDYLFGEGVCVIEWGDKFQHRLPEGTLSIHVTIDEKGGRTIAA